MLRLRAVLGVLVCLVVFLILDVVVVVMSMLTVVAQKSQHNHQRLTPPPPTTTKHSSCDEVSIFVDPELTKTTRRGHPRPLISIIYITKRPGGYDFLLNSLAQQEDVQPDSYELICVDELASYRARQVYSMAENLGVNLVAVVPSKPKSEAFSTTKFNIYNAINTGALLARGTVVTFIMDSAWIPSNFVRRTTEFYSNPLHAKSLLAYPEHFFHLKSNLRPTTTSLHDSTSLSLFPALQHTIKTNSGKTANTSGIATPLFDAKAMFGLGYKRPVDMVDALYVSKVPLGFEKQPRAAAKDNWGEFWELSFASLPYSCLEAINGAEEMFDVGDDCHEVNIRLRCKHLGYDLWIDGETVVECMWHKNELDTETTLWNRYQKDTVQRLVLSKEIPEIRAGKRPVQSSGHDFDLKTWRTHDCAAHI